MKDSHLNTPAPAATARAATLGEIRTSIVSAFMSPPPALATLRHWFDSAKIPRIKANPSAKRGGGPCYYSVSAVEKLLRSRMLPGRAH